MTNLLTLPTDDPNVVDIVDCCDQQFPVAAPLCWIETDLPRPEFYQRQWSLVFKTYLGQRPAPDYNLVPTFEF